MTAKDIDMIQKTIQESITTKESEYIGADDDDCKVIIELLDYGSSVNCNKVDVVDIDGLDKLYLHCITNHSDYTIQCHDGHSCQYKQWKDNAQQTMRQMIHSKFYTHSESIDMIMTGSEEKKEEKQEHPERDIVCSLSELKTIGILEKCKFGFVTLVMDPQTNKSYALKSVKKHLIVEEGKQAQIIREKRVLETLHNKFIVTLHRTYKDLWRVYFVLDACLGGTLFTTLRQRRYFDEATAQFYAACVTEAFVYMHTKNIIYRNLQPANILLDNMGYLKLADFGFAKEMAAADKTFTLCGETNYLAPEIVTGQGHGRAVDWWTLGVLIYEMLASFPPFFDNEPIETHRKIIRGRVIYPRYFTPEARDVIRGLLRNKPTQRLGILKGGANNIKKHGWFYGFNWTKLCKGTLVAPIINKVRNNKDLSNFVNSDDALPVEEALPVAPPHDFGSEF